MSRNSGGKNIGNCRGFPKHRLIVHTFVSEMAKTKISENFPQEDVVFRGWNKKSLTTLPVSGRKKGKISKAFFLDFWMARDGEKSFAI